MKKIDTRNLGCPQPLILTKKALSEENEIEVLFNSKVALENVKKLCKKLNCLYNTIEENGEFKLIITKQYKEQLFLSEDEVTKKLGKIYFIQGSEFGKGEKELGDILMKGFLYTLTQSDVLPKTIVFVNSGVKLACKNSASLDDLNKLLQGGTRIVSCGTCLDYYKLVNELAVGEVSNMYEIVEILSGSSEVITIG